MQGEIQSYAFAKRHINKKKKEFYTKKRKIKQNIKKIKRFNN